MRSTGDLWADILVALILAGSFVASRWLNSFGGRKGWWSIKGSKGRLVLLAVAVSISLVAVLALGIEVFGHLFPDRTNPFKPMPGDCPRWDADARKTIVVPCKG